MAKNPIFRFAFGNSETPATGVWRISVAKRGDVYLHNLKEEGTALHLAIHASGKTHFKFGNNRKLLRPPWKDPHGILWGPVLYFYDWNRPVPPLPATGNIEKVEWLGLPDKDHLFMVMINYVKPHLELVPYPNEKHLWGPVFCKLNDQDMTISVFLQHRPMSESELAMTSKSPADAFAFGGNDPKQMELIRVSENASGGPSAIIIERFSLV